MSRRGIVLATLLMVFPGAAASADVLKINIVNYARIERALLKVAIDAATQVFTRGGIESQWCEGSTSAIYSGCPRDAIRMVILPRRMRERLNLVHSEALGIALMTEDGQEGDTAYVFADRIEKLLAGEIAGRQTMVARLMGHVIAHEAGHLLMGAGNHRLRSIMTPFWGPAEIQGAMQGGLLFGPEHVERISEFLRGSAADAGS